MVSESRFWDRIAARYARQPIADEESYRKKLAITRGLLGPDMQLLEFGCGTGSTAIVHAPHARHIQAIDISPRMLDIARGKAEAAGITNITFEEAGIDDYEAPDGGYDMVLGLSILHLLADRDAAIAKVHRMLKPGGLFVTSTTCLGDSMRWMKAVVPVGRAVGLMPLVRVFTAQELEASLTGAGFAIEQNWQPGKGKAVFIVARKAG
ncbi:MAG: class I SAM-dependent methyltransferase [Bauldia sp.]|nr:class I SAM-dependent methyltransferase [Bauldia sp.]